MLSNRLLLSAAAALICLSTANAEHHLIVGAPVPPSDDGDVPLRRDINDLQAAAGPQWDLYVQALTAMQKMDSDDELSYFQISGIHGLPFIEWDHSGQQQGSQWLGYCPHGEPLFLPWHRPYVLLFEEQLVRHATAIAARYPKKVRAKYVAAAQRLRAPYWDWAADSAVPRASAADQLNINVAGKDDVKNTFVANPLQAYNLPQAALSGRYGNFDPRPRTLRCPGPKYSYPGTANQNLGYRNLKGNLYATFTYAQDFFEFALTGNNGIGLEQIHNWIHFDASCGEQFWQPDLSGFDPLFMLHHANVDRLWTYWQFIKPAHALWPDDGGYPGQSRYASAPGTSITPDSPLQPFFGTQSRMHTSRSVASISGMGYSYERLQYWNMTGEALQKAATAVINENYGGGGGRRRRRAEKRGGVEMQYFARFQIDRTQVERPSTVAVYIDGSRAGDVAVMPQPAEGIMKGGFMIDELVHRAAGSNGTIASIAHLVRLEVTKPDGARIPVESIPSLKLSLEEIPFTPPKSIEELPVLGTPVTLQVSVQQL